MLSSTKGEIYLDGKPCLDAWKIFYKLKDIAAQREFIIDLDKLIIQKECA